ncbi:MAG: hypothetical protein WAU01_03015 [Saprospiraceae bacterium]
MKNLTAGFCLLLNLNIGLGQSAFTFPDLKNLKDDTVKFRQLLDASNNYFLDKYNCNKWEICLYNLLSSLPKFDI